MAPLARPRRERFCQMIVEGSRLGWTQASCYIRAGYRGEGHTAAVNANKLLNCADIKARIGELLAPPPSQVKRARATLDDLSEQFDRVFAGAFQAEQFGAAGSMAVAKAKLLGFMRDQIEVGGPGSFAACKTREELVDMACAEFGSPQAALEALDVMRAMIEERASRDAILIPPKRSEPRDWPRS